MLKYFGLQWLCPSNSKLWFYGVQACALAMQDNGLNLDQTLERQVGKEASRRSSKGSLSSHFHSAGNSMCSASACLCKLITSVPHTKGSRGGFLFTSGQALHQDATALIPVLRVTANAVTATKFKVTETFRITWISQWGIRRYARIKYSQMLASGQCLASSMLHASKSRMRSWDEFHLQKKKGKRLN